LIDIERLRTNPRKCLMILKDLSINFRSPIEASTSGLIQEWVDMNRSMVESNECKHPDTCINPENPLEYSLCVVYREWHHYECICEHYVEFISYEVLDNLKYYVCKSCKSHIIPDFDSGIGL
jgi:hypothetical protein